VPLGFQGKGEPCNLWIDPTFTGGFDGLAQVRQALDSVPGVLAGYNSKLVGDAHSPYNHLLNQKKKDHSTGYLLMHFYV
jgi:hypothetical protein